MENKIEILKDEQVLYSTEKQSVALILWGVILAIFFFVVGILMWYDSGFVVAVFPMMVAPLCFLLLAYYVLLHRRYDKMIVTNKGVRWTQMKKKYFIEYKDIRTCELHLNGMTITPNNVSRCMSRCIININLEYTKFDSRQICEAINKAYAEYEARNAQMKGLLPAYGIGSLIDYEKFANKRMRFLIFRIIIVLFALIYLIIHWH